MPEYELEAPQASPPDVKPIATHVSEMDRLRILLQVERLKRIDAEKMNLKMMGDRLMGEDARLQLERDTTGKELRATYGMGLKDSVDPNTGAIQRAPGETEPA